MEVIKAKTKIMVFRMGGYLSLFETWHFDDCNLEVVNEYSYLGFKFTTVLSLKQGTNHLVGKATKAVFCLGRSFQRLKEMTKDTFFQNISFNSPVHCALLIRDLGTKRLNSIGKVHLLACKGFLGPPVRTPNKMIYGNFGRYQLFINYAVRCLKYWFRLREMDHSRLPRQA